MQIPDLTTTAKTSLDFPFHCSSVQPRRVKGEAGVKWDTVLEFTVDKEDVGQAGLPAILADLRAKVLGAVEGTGEFTASFRPSSEFTGTLQWVSGDTRGSVFLGTKGVCRKVRLTATAKGVRIRYHLRWDGDGTEPVGQCVESDVLVEVDMTQKAIPFQPARVTSLPPEPGDKPAPKRGRTQASP